jgi:hypothetical protein
MPLCMFSFREDRNKAKLMKKGHVYVVTIEL